MMKRVYCLLALSVALLLQSPMVTAVEADTATARTGEFSTRATVLELLGESIAQRYEPILPVDKPIDWQVYVPENYDPQKPVGLLVYISPSNSGRIPDDWKALMAQYNLIWIAADNSGNNRAVLHRITYALLANALIERDYRVDVNRRYLSGFSGGGRVASMVAVQYPDLFNGAIYNCGVNFWGDNTPDSIERVKRNRYVFITGAKDFNKSDTRRVFHQYENAGLEQIKLMVIPFMGHRNPGSRDFGKAIAWLDGEVED
jgi:predicted peptidase